MKKYVKIALLVIVALIFLGTFVFLYQKSQPKETVYNTEKAEIADLKRTTVATGKIEPRDEILIKPQISGIIDEVYKEAGQTVKKGEVIAKVKVIPELGQLNSAESRVRLAEINAKQEIGTAHSDTPAHFQISFWMAIGACILLMILGTLAGLAPAYRAMAIKPIEAIRDE